MKKIVLILLIPFILFGCSFAPKLTLPKLKLPKSSAKGAKISKKWWRKFGSITLDRLIDSALKNNEDILLAYEKVKEAKTTYDIAKANLLPILQTQANATRNSYPNNSYPKGIHNYYTLTGQVSYEPDLFGKLSSAKKAQLEALLEQRAYARLVRLSLISNLITSYFQLCATNEKINNAQLLLKSQKEILKIFEKLYKNGLSDEKSIEIQKSNLSFYKLSLIELKKLKNILNSEISFLAGKQPNQIFNNSIVCKKLPRPLPIPAFLPLNILKERPDIIESLAQLKAANFDIGVAESKYFPNINITGSSGYESGKFHQLIVPNARFWNLATNIITPLFEFGRIKKGIQLAKIRKREALINYIKTVRSAFLDVHKSLISVKYSKERLSNLNKNLSYKKKIYDIQKMLYQNGLSDRAKLLSSKLDYLNAKDNSIQARLNYLIQEIKLYKSLGGEW